MTKFVSINEMPKNHLITSMLESLMTSSKASCPKCKTLNELLRCDHCSQIFCNSCLNVLYYIFIVLLIYWILVIFIFKKEHFKNLSLERRVNSMQTFLRLLENLKNTFEQKALAEVVAIRDHWKVKFDRFKAQNPNFFTNVKKVFSKS